MDKINIKKIAFYLSLFLFTFLCLLVLGQGNGQTGLTGDINLIDEGQYAAWIFNMLHGKLIYKDFYVQYGPLMVFPYYFMVKILGNSFLAFRIWNAIQIGITIVVFIAFLRELKIRKTFQILAFTSLILVPGINIRYMLGVIIIYFLVMAYKTNKNTFFIFSQIIFVISLFLSIEVAIFSLSVIAIYLIIRVITVNNIRKELKLLLKLVTPLILLILLLSFFFYSQGWFLYYLSTTYNFLFSLSGSDLPNGYGLPVLSANEFNNVHDLIKYLASRNVLFYLSFIILTFSFAVLLIRASITKKSNDVFLLLITVFTLFLYFGFIGRSGHYFNLFPFCLLIIFYVGELGINYLTKLKHYRFAFLILILILLYSVRHISIFRTSQIQLISLYFTGQNIEKAGSIKVGKAQKKDINILFNFVSNNTKYSEKIYILNNNPGLYYIVERQNATRYDLPLLAGTLEKRLEIVSVLKKQKPKIIIEDLEAWDVDGVSDKERMPEVFNYVKNNYKKTKVIGRYRIYSLKPFSDKT